MIMTIVTNAIFLALSQVSFFSFFSFAYNLDNAAMSRKSTSVTTIRRHEDLEPLPQHISRILPRDSSAGVVLLNHGNDQFSVHTCGDNEAKSKKLGALMTIALSLLRIKELAVTTYHHRDPTARSFVATTHANSLRQRQPCLRCQIPASQCGYGNTYPTPTLLDLVDVDAELLSPSPREELTPPSPPLLTPSPATPHCHTTTTFLGTPSTSNETLGHSEPTPGPTQITPVRNLQSTPSSTNTTSSRVQKKDEKGTDNAC